MATKIDYQNTEFGDGTGLIEIISIGFEPLLTPEEYSLYKEIGDIKKDIYAATSIIKFFEQKLMYNDDYAYNKWANNHLSNAYKKLSESTTLLPQKKEEFKELRESNIEIVRTLYTNREFSNEDQYRNIALFESDLTRTFGCKDLDHCDDIVSVTTYYTEIFDSIIHNGFMYKGKKFVFFTAGAGQTRNKKSTFVAEDKLNDNYQHLFCGLTKDVINELGGMNTNKYLAYTSLCQTNSSIWKEFNIDRCIVVDDIEYIIPNQRVRHIYTETPDDKEIIAAHKEALKRVNQELKQCNILKKEIKGIRRRTKDEINHEKILKERRKNILKDINDCLVKYHSTEIKEMDITIPFTDGFGITFIDSPSTMIRMPFVKGLVAYVSRDMFKEWCQKNNKEILKIKDIYGKSYSIDEVDYILTKSQFKMYKYYTNELNENGNIIKTGWEKYREFFKKYNCNCGRCNIEDEKVKLDAKTNYQILQTLTTEMTDRDITALARYDIENLNGIGNNVQCMLNVLGANPDKNSNMSWLQRSLNIYPELLKDFYVKNLMVNTKNSMIKKFRSGKFNINGAYVFAIPDTVACLQWWFLGERDLDKLGFVQENTIFCKLFNDKEELDCLRSPHLDHAHCIRKNNVTNEKLLWYPSSGVYIGVKDIMSKLLMYDNDGDKLLVHNNKTIIGNAKAYQKKYEMVPNYYDMPKANPEILDNDSLFNGITMAYHHGNIGTPSNEITKIFATLGLDSTEEEIKEAIEAVALRCCDVNYVIDYAKTLYKPTIPKHIKELYKKYSGYKVPHFFMYAKDKRIDQVEEKRSGNIDRIEDVVQAKRIKYSSFPGKYNVKMLMNDPKVDIKSEKAQSILKFYRDIEERNMRKLSKFNVEAMEQDEKRQYYALISLNSKRQRNEFCKIFDCDKEYITDVLLKCLKNDINKDLLWRLFGDVIYHNIEKNLGSETRVCDCCKDRFTPNSPTQRYCDKCKSIPSKHTPEDKIIQCIGYEGYECGANVYVKPWDVKTCRCKDCQKIYKRKYQADLMRQRRNN